LRGQISVNHLKDASHACKRSSLSNFLDFCDYFCADLAYVGTYVNINGTEQSLIKYSQSCKIR
jgi:hypothetical protein